MIEALKSGDEQTLASLKAETAAAPDSALANASGALYLHCQELTRT